jgi:hypothetical protein
LDFQSFAFVEKAIMWQVLGWIGLLAGVVSLLMALRAMERATSGPYGDVMPPGMRGMDVPPDWKRTYLIIAGLWWLACPALIMLGAHLLPDVKWLDRFRIWGRQPDVPVAPAALSLWSRASAAAVAFWQALTTSVSAWWVVVIAWMTAAMEHWVFWELVLCLLIAAVLEFRYELLRTTEQRLALSDRFWRFRRFYRTCSVVQWAVMLCGAGLGLAVVATAGWDWAVLGAGWPPVVPPNQAELFAIPGGQVFFGIALGSSALAGLSLVLWCRRTPLYDLFISYKSQDAPLAREVTDRLMAGGTRVWLAEYEIPLRWEAKFLDYIAYGIRRSRFGLAFTHEAYARSLYCREEMETLLRACGWKRLLRVRPHDTDPVDAAFPAIAQAPMLRSDGSVAEILAFIERQTGLKASGPSPEPFGQDFYRGSWMGRTYTLDTTGWETAKGGATW